jgi:hypothetical protein
LRFTLGQVTMSGLRWCGLSMAAVPADLAPAATVPVAAPKPFLCTP